MTKIFRLVIMLFIAHFGGATPALSGSISVMAGAIGGQNGGPGPLGIPPAPYQFQFDYITDAGTESRLALTGILFGHRFETQGLYASIGGGLVIDGNGVGFGPYMAYGYISGNGSPGTYHFNAEFMQAISSSVHHVKYASPYSVSIGCIWK